MAQKTSDAHKKRYPAAYEKGVPVAIGLIVVIVVAMLVLAVGIALGLIQTP